MINIILLVAAMAATDPIQVTRAPDGSYSPGLCYATAPVDSALLGMSAHLERFRLQQTCQGCMWKGTVTIVDYTADNTTWTDSWVHIDQHTIKTISGWSHKPPPFFGIYDVQYTGYAGHCGSSGFPFYWCEEHEPCSGTVIVRWMMDGIRIFGDKQWSSGQGTYFEWPSLPAHEDSDGMLAISNVVGEGCGYAQSVRWIIWRGTQVPIGSVTLRAECFDCLWIPLQ